MRVYEGSCKVAIVVNDNTVNVVSVADCMEEHGVCVWMKVKNSDIYVYCVYCQFSMWDL